MAFFWSGTFVAMPVALAEMPPILFTALRFSVVVPLVFFIGRQGIPWRLIWRIGFVLCVLAFTLAHVGIWFGTPPGLSSLLMQTQAVFTAIFAWTRLGLAPSGPQRAGLLVAVAGLVAAGWSQLGAVDSLVGIGFILLSAACLGWNNIELRLAKNVDMNRLSIYCCLVAPPPLLLLSFCTESGQIAALANISPAAVVSVLYMGLIASVASYAIWGRLLLRNPPTKIAPFSLLVPVFGFTWAYLFFGETFTTEKFIATVLMFVGLLLIVADGYAARFAGKISLLWRTYAQSRTGS